MIAVVHHPDYLAAATVRAGSYRGGKNGAIRDLLLARGDIDWFTPEPMPRRWLEAAHDPAYVAEVLEARVPQAKERRIGFPVTEAVARRTCAVAGGTYDAARIALERGYAANGAGGSHHALADTGAGYCVFNDLAIAAIRLAAEGYRVAVVDCDVHQGDGTAALTAGRPGIVTCSIHAEKNFPARKARSTVDIDLPDGTGDAAYLAALEAALVPLLDAERPDIILYQAGVDPHAEDRLGRLSLTDAGLVARETLVARLAIARGIALASTVGGGYGADMEVLARRHVAAIVTLGKAFAGWTPAADRVEPRGPGNVEAQ